MVKYSMYSLLRFLLCLEPEESLVPLMDGLSADGGDLETDYQGRLSNVTNIPRQPDYLLGLATGRRLHVSEEVGSNGVLNDEWISYH